MLSEFIMKNEIGFYKWMSFQCFNLILILFVNNIGQCDQNWAVKKRMKKMLFVF